MYHLKKKTIVDSSGYMVLVILGMLYVSIMICNAVLTNRYIGNDAVFVLGGSFTSPLIFILDNIIAEIYGYNLTRSMIYTAFVAQTFFVVICQIVLMTPHPEFFKEQNYYAHVLGYSLVRINFSGLLAYIIANLVNSRILSRWKVLLKGKYFWLRSLGASIVAEVLYSFIAILMMELASIPFKHILKVVLLSFSIKAFYSVVLAAPANILVKYLKDYTGIDVYDFPNRFTPFVYSRNVKDFLND
ncbi:hypothetical protein B1207_07700 [Legionella quinlivanii]|uniref:Queuosine precursor transporter n=1 Tax=Legionella quinlivanii TaxID=45073 RepID=A0A364LJJ0_9GAMM|nr:queuosine precursor transporter [Legionella quinlivanii]RAP36678.1 hypothetical protein B1207_07700 [Legionella quinlivanii]